MNGEEFLNKLYKQLNLSAEVMHTSSGTKNKDEAVKRYMDRLELIHNKVTNQHKLELLKNLYYKKYIVREEDIPRYRDKEKIITAQKESLDKWLNYLLDENARYPMWAKYWAFQGMLTIGTFNEITGTYQKRSKKTLAPFIEVNPEMLSKCIGLVVNYVEKNELTDTELEKLVESGNFSKLYTISLKNNQKKLNKLSDKEDGIWVTYHYESLQDIKTKEKDGIEPEYLKLYKSLQGYNTGWCTAGDKEMAKAQICGSDEYYDGGNFYVYYTKNVNNEYKVPRIAIRMDGTDEIGEIKGIEDGQNLEEGLEDIIESKLQTLGLKEQTIINYLTIISNMKKITELNKKAKNKVAFNTEDIKFIYGKIECFGWEKDPRIEKILETRNIENDFSKLSNDDLKELIKVDCEYFHHIPTDKKHNKEIAIVTVRQNGFFIQYIPTSIDNYSKVALEAVKRSSYAIKYIPTDIDEYSKIALESVKKFGLAIEYIPTNIEGYSDVALEAVKQSGYAIKYIPINTEEYYEIAKEAVKQSGYAIQFISPDLEGYYEIAKEAIKQKGFAIEYIPTYIEGYKELALKAIKEYDATSLYYIPKYVECYKEIALEAVRINGFVIEYVPTDIEGYIEIAMEAIKQNYLTLAYIPEEVDGYEQLQMIAIEAINKHTKKIRKFS